MGNTFGLGGAKGVNTLSAAQRNLLPGLGAFFGDQLGEETVGVDELRDEILGSRGGDQALSREIFQQGFLDPALRTFDDQIAPRIDTGFAGIGGTLSSRRGTARADALTSLLTSAQGDFTRMLPQILGFSRQNALVGAQGLSAANQLNFQNANQASGFLGIQTKQVVNESPGVGFDILGDAIGAAALLGAASSRRWKTDIRLITSALGMVERLQGVYYTWDEEHGGKPAVGMIAEDVGQVLPEVVQYEENGIDALSIEYSKIVPLLVEAIKGLSSEVEELRSQIEAI